MDIASESMNTLLIKSQQQVVRDKGRKHQQLKNTIFNACCHIDTGICLSKLSLQVEESCVNFKKKVNFNSIMKGFLSVDL